MKIDRNRVMCLVGADFEQNPNEAEFYEVGEILKLMDPQYNSLELTGHPGKDIDNLPPKKGGMPRKFSCHLTTRESRAIKRWLDLGLCVSYAVTVNRKNKTKLLFSFARFEDHLTDEQLFWIKSYIQTGHLYAQKIAVTEILTRLFKSIGEVAKMAQDSQISNGQKKKKKRKQRKKRDREYLLYGDSFDG